MKLGKIIKTSAMIITTVAVTSLISQTSNAGHVWGHAGTTYSKYGNQTYGSDGSVYSKYGNQTYGRDGSGNSRICSKYGNHTYCN